MRIDVKGTVIPDNYAWIYDYFDEPYVSPGKIHAALEEAAGEDIDIDINSGGGEGLLDHGHHLLLNGTCGNLKHGKRELFSVFVKNLNRCGLG